LQFGGRESKGIFKKSHENMPLISVITIVYNGGKTLEETILSVVNQTYQNIEYIIIDGNSTDNTLEIIKNYEEKIDYWISASDTGIYNAMNKGIDHASGDWINFMNSGDSFFSEIVVQEIVKHIDSGVDVLYGDIRFNNGVIYKQSKTINDFFFLMEHMICHQSIFSRKSYLKHHFDEQYNIVSDKDWLINAFNQGAVFRHIPLIICNYDYSGISSNIKNFQKDSENLIRNHYGRQGLFFILIKRFIRKIIKLNKPFRNG
jgi:glycosyltransferase involved in cell wall biosynthesis